MTKTAALLSRLNFTRRRVLTASLATASIAFAAVTFLVPTPAQAQRSSGPSEVPMEALMKPIDGLEDIVLGNPEAKVAVVEYASLTCGHCSHFHKENFPALKKKYIDAGKISFIMREFPLDNLAAAGAMLARCAPNGKIYAMTDLLFNTQADWAYDQGNPVPKLFEIAKQAGFTQETFDKCLKDQKLLDQINAQRSRAADQFGVSATPTFFVNGKKLQGAPNVEAFDAMIEPLLK